MRGKTAQSSYELVIVHGFGKDKSAILWNATVADFYVVKRKSQPTNPRHILPRDFLLLPSLSFSKAGRVHIPVVKEMIEDKEEN
jgi:hypothetical protein